jgi:cytidyltransferase-like protein
VSDCVLIGGVFDPLHTGHLAYLHEARKYGAYVCCALSDAPAKHPPLVPLEQRAELLRHLGVNRIITHQDDLCGVLRTIQPRVYLKGKDWDGRLPPEQVETCRELGIRIDYLDTVTESSSRLLAEYQRKLNAEKLAAFEEFVANQKPAAKPWEPVTDYSFEARKEIEGPHAQIIRDTFRPCVVADIGCGPNAVLVQMLRALGVNAVGLDSTQPKASHTFRYDLLNGSHWYNAGASPDLVICREVLEHLTARQVAIAVRNLVTLSSKYIYVTTRFTAKPHLLDVDGSDDLDPTHMTMLNQDLLRTLFVLEGCRRRVDLEAALDWRKLGRCLVYEVPR